LARLKPQSAPSLVERIVQEIKSSIIMGDLRPGEQFSIGELATELDVSHIPVREALRRLEADGLIVLRPGRSAFVSPLSLDELEEVYRLRLLVETDLAGRSARSYTDEQLELAEGYCERLGVADPAGGNIRDPDAHHRLHLILLTPAAGPHSTQIVQRLMDISDRYVGLVYDARPVPFDEPYRRHMELVDAAKKRSAPAMRKALSAHLSENLDYMKTWLTPHLEAAEEEFAASMAAG
jgi:DNA-binding GntR family transcriptional regulator